MKISAMTQCDLVVCTVIFLTKHPGHKNKPITFFQSKKHYLKKLKITSKCFRQSSSAQILQVSFKIAHLQFNMKRIIKAEQIIKAQTRQDMRRKIAEAARKAIEFVANSTRNIQS